MDYEEELKELFKDKKTKICPKCKGLGTIVLSNAELVVCPFCNGKGKIKRSHQKIIN